MKRRGAVVTRIIVRKAFDGLVEVVFGNNASLRPYHLLGELRSSDACYDAYLLANTNQVIHTQEWGELLRITNMCHLGEVT